MTGEYKITTKKIYYGRYRVEREDGAVFEIQKVKPIKSRGKWIVIREDHYGMDDFPTLKMSLKVIARPRGWGKAFSSEDYDDSRK